MLLAYVDETGDTGPLTKGGSLTYALGCVLLDADDWPASFDEMVSFRRRLREKFGVLLRHEIKANYLLRSGGDLRDLNLSPGQRSLIFRAHLRALAGVKARAFAVVVDKRPKDLSGLAVFDLAWEGLLQRLERTSFYEKCTFMIVHDEGENDRVRKAVRRARRHLTAGSKYTTGTLVNPARSIVDDPMPRQSQHSLFIQQADLVAYAAFRNIIAPGAGIAKVCPQDMWLELGSACHTAVNKLNGGTPGIVVRK